MQHVVSLQAHKFQFWEEHFAFFGWEVEQNLIVNVVSVTIPGGGFGVDFVDGRNLFAINVSLRSVTLSDFRKEPSP